MDDCKHLDDTVDIYVQPSSLGALDDTIAYTVQSPIPLPIIPHDFTPVAHRTRWGLLNPRAPRFVPRSPPVPLPIRRTPTPMPL